MSKDNTFGSLLKEYRTKRKIGLREFCRRCGFDSGNVCAIESGRIAPPRNHVNLKKLVSKLNLTTKEYNHLTHAAFQFYKDRLHDKWLSYIYPNANDPTAKER